MERLFVSGHAVDMVFGVIALEVGLLLVYRSRTRRGLSARQLLSAVMPGVFLLLALRGALVGLDALAISAWLGAAFVAHIADIAARLRPVHRGAMSTDQRRFTWLAGSVRGVAPDDKR